MSDPTVAANLASELTKSKDYLESVRYCDTHRPSQYAVAYACAVREHAEAIQILMNSQKSVSVWPILRAQIIGMLWVHEFALDSDQALKNVEYSSVDERKSWGRKRPDADLLREEAVWREIGGAKPKDTDRCKSLDQWINAEMKTAQVGDAQNDWFNIWKMCSQTAHMGGNQIGHLMMKPLDDSGQTRLVIVPNGPRDDDIVRLLYDQTYRCLGFSMCRLAAYLSSHQDVDSSNGFVTLKPEKVKRYNALIKSVADARSAK